MILTVQKGSKTICPKRIRLRVFSAVLGLGFLDIGFWVRDEFSGRIVTDSYRSTRNLDNFYCLLCSSYLIDLFQPIYMGLLHTYVLWAQFKPLQRKNLSKHSLLALHLYRLMTL